MPDEQGARVAILVPFVGALATDRRDRREQFEAQTSTIMEHYAAEDRDPYAIMDATAWDFQRVMGDRDTPSVVVSGFGSFTSIAVPLSKDHATARRYGYLDWLHLAGMATHLKLGKFVMLQCGGFDRQFNPPLGAGVASSHANISAAAGQMIFTEDIRGVGPPIEPVTDVDELTYEEIKREFPLQRFRQVRAPDTLYVAVRGMYQRWLNLYEADKPIAENIPYPDLREFRAYRRQQ